MFCLNRKGFRKGFGSVMGFLTNQFDDRIIERFLEKGDIKHLVINALGKESMHGYQIISVIERDFQGLYTPSPGAIYPTLQMLEESGFVRAKSEGGKKVYSLTKSGKKELAANKQRVESILSRVLEHKDKHWFGSEMRVLTSKYSGLGRKVFRNAYHHRALDTKKFEDKLNAVAKVLDDASDKVVKIWAS